MKAWALLCETASWAPRFRALRLEGAEIADRDLMGLLGRGSVRELWVSRCGALGRAFWGMLADCNTAGEDYAARKHSSGKLEILGVMQCGRASVIDEGVVESIGRMRGLQVRYSIFLPFFPWDLLGGGNKVSKLVYRRRENSEMRGAAAIRCRTVLVRTFGARSVLCRPAAPNPKLKFRNVDCSSISLLGPGAWEICPMLTFSLAVSLATGLLWLAD